MEKWNTERSWRATVFRAHRKQLAFLRSKARLVALVGGAGSGKTTAGVMWSLMRAIRWEGSRGMMIARSYPQLKQSLLVELERWARESGLGRVWKFNRQDMEVRLPNGSRFWLRSADRPESLLGADLAWIYGDEVALWDEAAFKYALSRLRQPGFPHQAAFTFTPKGRNWAFEIFGKPRKDVEVIRCSTRENPYLDPGFVEMLEQQYGDTPFARQEIDGEFVAYEGLVYPQFSAQVHVRRWPEGARATITVAGVDWGYTSPGAIVVVAVVRGDELAGAWPSEQGSSASSCAVVASGADSRGVGGGVGVADEGEASAGGVEEGAGMADRSGVLAEAAGWYGGVGELGETLWAVDEFYAREIPPVGPGECWVAIARRLQERWGIEVFYCDPAEPANIDAFRRAGLPAVAGDNSVEPGIAMMAGLLSAGRLVIDPRCRNLVEEFGRYAYETDRDGNPTGRIAKAFDHALDALRYAVVGVQSRPQKRVFVQGV